MLRIANKNSNKKNTYLKFTVKQLLNKNTKLTFI